MADRVLLICYYFPPQGGAGVGRPLMLYRLLPEFGIQCDILTVKSVAYRVFEPELLEGLDISRIYRAGSIDPQRLMYLLGVRKVRDAAITRGRKISERFFPDPKIGWVRSAVKLGRVLTANRQYRVIVSTSPPMSSHLVGMKLSREFGLPLIVDFRDFWTGYKAEDWFDSERQIRRAKLLLEEITGLAAEVTTVSPAISEYLGRGEVIYNCYDETRAAFWRPPRDSKEFIIGILGTLDELRPVEPLFQLLARLRERHPEFFEHVRVLHVGSINQGDFDGLLRKYNLEGRFDRRGVQKRGRTVEILSESSALYIGFSQPYGKWLVTGRLFDMLASGRPILAAAPDDSVAGSLLREAGNSCAFNSDRLDQAVDFLISLIEARNRREWHYEPLPEYARKHSSAKMVERFAEVIRRVR